MFSPNTLKGTITRKIFLLRKGSDFFYDFHKCQMLILNSLQISPYYYRYHIFFHFSSISKHCKELLNKNFEKKITLLKHFKSGKLQRLRWKVENDQWLGRKLENSSIKT